MSAYALGMIVGGPVVTALTARLPRKPLIGGLVAVSILGNLGSALAPNYPVLLAARFAAGLVVATFFAVAISTAVSMAAPGREASTIAKVALGMNLGIVLGTPLHTLVGQDLGWRAAFAAVAAIAAVALPMVLGSVPAAPAPRPDRRAASCACSPDGTSASRSRSPPSATWAPSPSSPTSRRC